MVVVSSGWGKNISSNYQQQSTNNNNNNNHNNGGVGDMVIATTEMCAKAVLICRTNSHPFQERTLYLDQPVKVGRSVARARAAPNNAIFDCKVLSRHHALLSYENGKFFLQDTKSSNGTFVNNTRLSSNESEPPHELNSGDIVQFGVDVMENNRKVTHGCIIATIKLYLPDGKEAKASPSITEANRHGLVPLDELYKLNQIIQEAARREQCLETKLTALKHFTEEAKKSADYTWQVRVEEERLLSRVAALENQLLQAGKNWTNERLREEFTKLEEDKLTYQVAAKEALQKLHTEKLEALATATEQERARITAEEEAQLAREMLTQAEMELADLAQRLIEEQKRADEERTKLEQQENELKARLEAESQTASELKAKFEQLNALHLSNQSLFRDNILPPLEDLEKKDSFIYDDSSKTKGEYFAENESCELSNVETEQQYHINLTVAPVTDSTDIESFENGSKRDEYVKEEEVHVTFKLPNSTNKEDEDCSVKEEQQIKSEEKDDCFEKPFFDSDNVDSKTLKYQYQSIQNELKKQIEQLENAATSNKLRIAGLEKDLIEQKQITNEKNKLAEMLKQELQNLQQKWKESFNECQHLQDKVDSLSEEIKTLLTVDKKDVGLSMEDITALEEELVLLKEKYAQLTDEKTHLNKKLNHLQNQYNVVCNKSYNIMFFYIAPLVLMVLYLLISSMTS